MKPELIHQIEQLCGNTLHPAPVYSPFAAPFASLMAFRENQPKYLLDEQGQLIGLNLAATGLDDERWSQIAALQDENSVQLRALNLCGNELKRFVAPPGIAAMIAFDLDDNPLEFPPPEIVKQGNAAILRYVQAAAAQGTRDAFEVKMLIVGEGETGKTTLWNLLQNPNHPVPCEQDSTVGIQIKEGWEFTHIDRPEVTFLVNLWDFGGQEIQYMTHQFFLTRRSFYVLLADGRREAANFAYWLNIINVLGRNDEEKEKLPVLVVLNEKGSRNITLPYDPENVKEQYPGLEIIKREVDFAQKDERLDGVRKEIKRILCGKISHLPIRIPRCWDDVRTELRQRRLVVNHISQAEFAQVCQENSIPERQQQDDLSRFLHDLGFILHFHELSLKDFVVLNPNWAVNAVYAVLENEDVSGINQGRFNEKLLQDIWTAKGFSVAEQEKLLNLMLKDGLEVCFQAAERGEKIFIAPQLLPEEPPPGNCWTESTETLRYIYHYPFMPKGIIGRLIVRLHEDIEGCGKDDECGPDCRKMVWKNGVHLRKNGCRALVRHISDQKNGREIIKIEVQGAEAEERKHVLRDIREELNKLHRDSFPSLKVFQKIPCCCGECRDSLAPYEYDNADLERMKSKGVKEMRCLNSGSNVLICELQDGVFGKMEWQAEPEKETSAQVAVTIHNHLPQPGNTSAESTKKPWYLYLGLFIVDALTILANIAQFTGYSLMEWFKKK